MILDIQIREQALDVKQSFIVQAPAGSGKTELLTQRYLALLAHVASVPEAILAMTFTRKAAQEMRQRILLALKQAQLGTPIESPHQQKTRDLALAVLAKDAKALWGLLQNPQRIRVLTFDALCMQIAKQLPISSRLGAEPTIVEYSEPLYQLAAQQLLEHLDPSSPFHQPIRQLLAHLDHDVERTVEHLVAMLRQREQWLPFVARDYSEHAIQTDGLLDYLESSLQRIMLTELKQLAYFFNQDTSLRNLLISIWQQASHIAEPTHAMQQLALHRWLDASLDDLIRWQHLANWLLTQDDTLRSLRGLRREHGCLPMSSLAKADKLAQQAMREQWQMLLEQLTVLPVEALETLARVRNLPLPHYYQQQASKVQAIKMTLTVLAAELNHVFATQGQMDFIGIALCALQALGEPDEPTDLAIAMQQQIQALLIDEFQDTSVLQFDLLQRLTADWTHSDGKSLFLVGDPMQSIYRFRQAEVGLFLRAKHHGIGSITLQSLTLINNFRSTQSLVDWYNQHFAAIFPEHEAIASGAITYSQAAHTKTNTDNTGVTLQAFLTEQAGEIPYHAEAAYIAATLAHIRQQQPEAKLAILVRAKAQVAPILPWLRLYDLPYQTHDIDPLITKSHIQDLLALLKALNHLGDKLSWLALLRSPYVGLSLADLLILAEHKTQTIWENCQHYADTLSATGQQIIARISPLLTAALTQRFSISWADLLRGTWTALGGPHTLRHTQAYADIESFLNILSEYAQLNMIYDWAPFEALIQRRFASNMSLQTNPIELLTIHKSKGLEFDVVFLPGLERIGGQDHQALLLWHEEPNAENGTDLLLAPIKASGSDTDPVYRWIRGRHSMKADFELSRLLYVACTRAKQQLYLTANLSINAKADIRIHRQSCLSKLWPQLQQAFLESLTTSFADGVAPCGRLDWDLRTDACTKSASTEPEPHNDTNENTPKRIPSNWQSPLSIHRSKTNPANKDNARLIHLALTEDPIAKQRGIVLHSLLELFAVTPVKAWSSQLESWITLGERLLKQTGTAKRHEQDNRQWLTKVLKLMIADDRCQWLFDASHEDSAHELALLHHGDKPTQIRIDRTFVDKDGTRWIIDYKTAMLETQALNQFWDVVWPQYEPQLKQYAAALNALGPHPIRVGLYFPCVPAWFERACPL